MTPAVIERFEREYQKYHGLSRDRCDQQVRELERLAVHAGKASPADCTAEDFRSYLADLVGRGDLHVNTIRKRGNMIRPFFRWCFAVGIVDGEALMQILAVEYPNGATGRSAPKPYSAKELKRFWRELDEAWPYVADKWFARWRQGRSRYKRIGSHVMRLQIEAIIALALDCGLRRSEIYHLDIDDMHPDNEYIVVRPRTERDNGKNRLREVPHTAESRTAVTNWLEMRRELAPPHDRPWLSGYACQVEGGWLAPMSFESYEKRLLRSIGDWKLHRFRHTCATNWLRAGMSLEVVSRMLGHATVAQTLAYAEIIRDDITKQVQRNEGRFRQMTGRNVIAA